MDFNYAKEKRKFDQEWEVLRAQYEALGMEPDAIESLYDYDMRWFRSCRTYNSHTQPFPSERSGTGADSTLPRKYPSLVARGADEDSEDDLFWFEAMKKLSKLDILIIELRIKRGLTQAEIAKIIGCSQAAISKRMKRIKKIFLR